MEHDDPDDDGVPNDPWDEFLMATMAWEGGLPQLVAKAPEDDEPEKIPDG